MSGLPPKQMRELAEDLSYVNSTSNDEAVSHAVTALRAAADQIEIVQGMLQAGHQPEKFAEFFPELSVRCERCAAPIFKRATRWIDPTGNDAHHAGGSDWEAHMPPWKEDA